MGPGLHTGWMESHGRPVRAAPRLVAGEDIGGTLSPLTASDSPAQEERDTAGCQIITFPYLRVDEVARIPCYKQLEDYVHKP